MKYTKFDFGRDINWDNVSRAYAEYRQGYPTSFYDQLYSLGIGLSNQRILDLGTGTGELAINFAKRGANVTAIDVSESQIMQAQRLAKEANVAIKFFVSSCEDMPLTEESCFDIVSASLCWTYFNEQKVYPQIKRLLVNDGKLFVSYLLWLADDPIVSITEEIILKYNKLWTGGGFVGDYKEFDNWDSTRYNVLTKHDYRINQTYSLPQWIGRILSHRAVGGSLSKEDSLQLVNELENSLKRFSEPFSIAHIIFYHVISLKS